MVMKYDRTRERVTFRRCKCMQRQRLDAVGRGCACAFDPLFAVVWLSCWEVFLLWQTM